MARLVLAAARLLGEDPSRSPPAAAAAACSGRWRLGAGAGARRRSFSIQADRAAAASGRRRPHALGRRGARLQDSGRADASERGARSMARAKAPASSPAISCSVLRELEWTPARKRTSPTTMAQATAANASSADEASAQGRRRRLRVAASTSTTSGRGAGWSALDPADPRPRRRPAGAGVSGLEQRAALRERRPRPEARALTAKFVAPRTRRLANRGFFSLGTGQGSQA